MTNASKADFDGVKALVLGLGNFGGGVGAARWLASCGARVVASDSASAEKLQSSIAELSDLPVEFAFGPQSDALLDGCDLIVVNPAIPLEVPILASARRRGIKLTSEIGLFIAHCPAKIAGITGTVGKSTTTAMAHAAIAAGRECFMGGNIGRSLLGELGRITADSAVVLELSSFQLELLSWQQNSPDIALVTNIAPNHLDRHHTMAAYADAKKNIFRYQNEKGLLLLPAADEQLAGWASETPGKCEFYSADGFAGGDLLVPGEHNRTNAAAAMALAKAFDADPAKAAAAIANFGGLPDRLEFVTERSGVRYYNDSKATTPDGVRVAVSSFGDSPVIAIVGGYDKKIPLGEMARLLKTNCKAVITTGAVGQQILKLLNEASETSEAAPKISNAIGTSAGEFTAEYHSDFDDAVAAAQKLAASGDVVVLSPGCASYGQFTNYQQRGQRFRQLVSGD